jgi:alpha-beta hydrolase superfamily lysophospholipase
LTFAEWATRRASPWVRKDQGTRRSPEDLTQADYQKQSGFKEEADDLEAVIAATLKVHKLKVVAIIAHSRGGTTSTFYYSRKTAGEKPKHLILINPSFAQMPTRKDQIESYEKVEKTGQSEGGFEDHVFYRVSF